MGGTQLWRRPIAGGAITGEHHCGFGGAPLWVTTIVEGTYCGGAHLVFPHTRSPRNRATHNRVPPQGVPPSGPLWFLHFCVAWSTLTNMRSLRGLCRSEDLSGKQEKKEK